MWKAGCCVCTVGGTKQQQRLTEITCSHSSYLLYTVWSQHKLGGWRAANCLSDNPFRLMVKTACPVAAGLYVEIHVAFWSQVRHVRTWSYPLTDSLVFRLPFLLGDTVSSASLHRLTESWGWVQSMFQITRRKRTERPVATADPLKLRTSEPKKGFPPILWKAVFSSGKQVFVITELCGERKLGVSRKNQALARIKTVKVIASFHLVSSLKFTRVSCEIGERLN